MGSLTNVADTLPSTLINRQVHCADAVAWLRDKAVRDFVGCSMVTSLPDRTEFPEWSHAQWESWFTDAAALVLSRTPEEGVAIFFQTDSRYGDQYCGVWTDKSFLCQTAAIKLGFHLVWRKVVCRVAPDVTAHGLPGFSNLLCFAKIVNTYNRDAVTPDVIATAGASTWTRGMGLHACAVACRFVKEHTASHTIVDPFCGHGTVLAVANSVGLDAIGVDIAARRVKKARQLRVGSDGKLQGRDSNVDVGESAAETTMAPCSGSGGCDDTAARESDV